jgi:hypothetical protein
MSKMLTLKLLFFALIQTFYCCVSTSFYTKNLPLPAPMFSIGELFPQTFCINIIFYTKTIKHHKSSDNVDFRPSAGFRWISLHELRIFS